MATNKELADKYPVKYSRDGGPESNRFHPDGRVTLGYLIMKFADIAESVVDRSRSSKLADWIDQEFLFGCWGHVMREVRERDFGRDINGFIVAAFSEGMLRGRFDHPPPAEKEPAAEEWCWREPDSEVAFGSFESREEAIEEARECTDVRAVMVSRCVHPDPVYTAGQVVDMDDILERMHEFACDNEMPHAYDDEIFELRDVEAAREALRAAVVGWAREHIMPCTVWHTSDSEEEVEIHPPPEAS